MKKPMIREKLNINWVLVLYDIIVFAFSCGVLTYIYRHYLWDVNKMDGKGIVINSVIAFVCLFLCRLVSKVYNQIWRYSDVVAYIRIIVSDMAASAIYVGIEFVIYLLFGFRKFPFSIIVAFMSVYIVLSVTMRMVYRYCYKCCNNITTEGKILTLLLKIFARITVPQRDNKSKIRVAIVGAGSAGAGLAEELLNNNNAPYLPICFIDVSAEKIGRQVQGLPIFSEAEATFEILKEYEIQEIILALPKMAQNRKKELFDYYKQSGCKIKVYDYPAMLVAGGKRQLREFDIEDLLFREEINMSDDKTIEYFSGKTVMITGGGGSIGSELCRQIADMKPKRIIILDIYENGVYNVQQELKFKHGDDLDLRVEIASITDEQAMRIVFDTYHPQVIINAAAHKHVPLMEHNCVEAIKNNIFGTKVVLELCEEYGAERFMMVSTDKAVNPTNVMGATKRMCEMLVESFATRGTVKCSCTRFGNVLGSAGSVIPLFKKQIAAGGPITITDKRIIRYFMTIPEASQLVLQSGAMAKNGELFVLDMGQPVKIIDLAENMIRLSGVNDIAIIETGLRPGEKLYEELLLDSDTLEKTDNSLIFIERDTPLPYEEIQNKLKILEKACDSMDNDKAREALASVVPTFKRPEEVNSVLDNK